MIKRTIEISRRPAHVHTRLGQLCIDPHPDPVAPPEELAPASVPCEDIGMVLVDHPRTTYSHSALAALIEHGALLIVCGRKHLPAGLLLPLPEHGQVAWRLQEQIALGKPLRKRLWKQLIVAKIRAQAANLPDDAPARERLRKLAREVRSGDPANVEAQAARIYWSRWLGDDDAFRRRPQGEDIANSLLNYGYALVRAALARALVAAGLLPALGLHHANRANAFALADDLIEPLRPLVDHRVRTLLQAGCDGELDQPTKARLLDLLTVTVSCDKSTGPLMVALHRYAASLAACLAGQADRLLIPLMLEAES